MTINERTVFPGEALSLLPRPEGRGVLVADVDSSGDYERT